jgi:hypothetical protein
MGWHRAANYTPVPELTELDKVSPKATCKITAIKQKAIKIKQFQQNRTRCLLKRTIFCNNPPESTYCLKIVTYYLICDFLGHCRAVS